MIRKAERGQSCPTQAIESLQSPYRGFEASPYFFIQRHKVEIFAGLCAEGRAANRETADEIMNRLEAKENYIPSSESTRREYRNLLLKEYRGYISSRADKGAKIGIRPPCDAGLHVKGVFPLMTI